MLTVCMLALVALALLGWCAFVQHRLALAGPLVPYFVFSSIGCVMVAAGLLNLFWLAQWGLLLGGLGLLGVALAHPKTQLRAFCTPGWLAFGAAVAWLLWLVRGGVIAGHDNMSHWAMVAKAILTDDRLPNTANAAVEFVGYPPGSACFIKFIGSFTGVSDGMFLFAQGLLLLGGLLTLGALVPQKQWLGGLLAAVFGAVALCVNVLPASLVVDTLLATQALGALTTLVCVGRENPRRAAFLALPGLTFLALIKNSGLFFVLPSFAVLCALCAGQGGLRRFWKPLAATLAVPAGALLLWQRHVAMVFPAEESSKHAVSLTAYGGIFGEKSAKEIAQYNRLFWARLVNFAQPDVRFAWALAVLLALTLLLLRARGWLKTGQAVLLAAGFAAAEGLYLASLWATYAFSMNTSEMLALASFGRYHWTMQILLAGCWLALVLCRVQPGKQATGFYALALAGVLALGLLGSAQPQALYSRAVYHNTETQGELLDWKAEYGLRDGARYLIYTRGGEVDTWDMRYTARYVFNSNRVDFWQYAGETYTLDELYHNYDYLLVYAPDAESEAYLAQAGWDSGARCIELVQ